MSGSQAWHGYVNVQKRRLECSAWYQEGGWGYCRPGMVLYTGPLASTSQMLGKQVCSTRPGCLFSGILKKLRQEDLEFEASLGCIVRSHPLSPIPPPKKNNKNPERVGGGHNHECSGAEHWRGREDVTGFEAVA